MEIINSISELREKIKRIDCSAVGLIHTKGALHEGHISLIQAARKENYLLVLSNLLIPREFTSIEAYDLYPRTSAKDQNLASLAGADFFFMPDVKTFENSEQVMGVEIKGELKNQFNGMGRPRYYDEQMTTLVKLMNIIKPNHLYMSDKDLQLNYFTRCLLKQFHYDCDLCILPAIRDKDHIVLGGKNALLKPDERKQVADIYKVFNKAQVAYNRGMISSKKLKWHVENEMSKLYLCQMEFIEIVESEQLRKIETIVNHAILLLGVRVGKIRICDYVILRRNEQ